jgi:hypothetical protein
MAPGPAHDARLGLYPAVDLVALASAVRRGGVVAWGGPGGPVRLVVTR